MKKPSFTKKIAATIAGCLIIFTYYAFYGIGFLLQKTVNSINYVKHCLCRSATKIQKIRMEYDYYKEQKRQTITVRKRQAA